MLHGNKYIGQVKVQIKTVTPRKNNMEHKHRGLEDHFPFQMGDL